MRRIAVVAAALGLAACASPRPPAVIVPYDDGRYTASAAGATEREALQSAVDGARAECAHASKALAVKRSSTKFKGVLTPELSKTVKEIHRVIDAAAPVPDLSSDEDYEVTVEFSCR